MSGAAPAGGFEFQADAFAFVAAHALTGHPLDWFDRNAATPLAIAMETGGAGDDMSIDLSDGRIIEVQAKKGLNRGEEFDRAILNLARGLDADPMLLGVLLVNPAASTPIRETLRQDFLRLSGGRSDALKPETEDLLNRLERDGITDRGLFRRLRIIAKDFAVGGDGRAAGIALLRTIISDGLAAGDAWTTLSDEGLALCARRGRRSKEQLAELLQLQPEAALRLLVTQRYRDWLMTSTASFFVPALNARLASNTAWDEVRWLTPASAMPRPSSHSIAAELERYHEWSRLADDFDVGRSSAHEFIEVEKHLVFVGGPGSGKSTLLTRIAYESATAGKTVARVSLQVVRRLMLAGRTFDESIAAAASQASPINQQQAASLLTTADLLLADGLDETEPDRLVVATAVHQWTLAHPHTVVCVTTRPIGHQPNLLPKFREAEVLPLGRYDVGPLATTLFEAMGYSTEDAVRLTEPFSRRASKRKVNDAASLAMRNPLLLTFLVRLHAEGEPIEGRRVRLYERIIELIRRSSSSDRETAPDPGTVLSRAGLHAFAWKMQVTPGCSRSDAVGFAADYFALSTAISALAAAETAAKVEAFWEDRRLLERVQAGTEEALTFVHLSLAEFAAANHLHTLPATAISELLVAHRRDPRWREVIVLASGLGSAEKIVPQLLALDDADDPCSIEAVLAAECLNEVENPDSAFLTTITSSLAVRLDSPVPFISAEAAQRLVSLAPAAPSLVEEVCVRRLMHEQRWTRLGAYAALLAAGSDALSAEQIEKWVADDTQSTGFLGNGLPDEARDLRLGALPRGFDRLFNELPREKARKFAAEFLETSRMTLGEFDAVKATFLAHRNDDLFAKFDRPDRFAALMRDESPGTREFLQLVLTALGKGAEPRPADGTIPLPNTLKVLEALDWWEQPIHSSRAFTQNDSALSAREVLRGVIYAIGVSTHQLANEINHVLAQERADLALFDAHRLGKQREPVDWKKASEAGLQMPPVVEALLHPSQMIRVAAAHLIAEGVDDQATADSVRSLLPRAINHGLLCVAWTGAKIWGADAVGILIARFKNKPFEGTEYICNLLAELANRENRAEILDLLIRALNHPRPAVAEAAVKALGQLKQEATPEYVQQLKAAFRQWRDAEFICERCGTSCASGSCPKCHVVPRTPFKRFVEELSRVNAITPEELFQLVNERWSSAKEGAVEALTKLCATDERILQDLIERCMRDRASAPVLDEMLKGAPGLSPAIAGSVLRLRDSADASIRLRIIEALTRLNVERGLLIRYAKTAVTDESPSIRSAAVRALRLFENSNKISATPT